MTKQPKKKKKKNEVEMKTKKKKTKRVSINLLLMKIFSSVLKHTTLLIGESKCFSYVTKQIN